MSSRATPHRFPRRQLAGQGCVTSRQRRPRRAAIRAAPSVGAADSPTRHSAMRTSAAATGAALLVFVAVVSAMEMTPEFMEIINKCKAEHEPTEDELKGIMMMKVPESEHGKCFMGCVLQEVGVVKDGKFDKEEAKKHAAAKMSDKDELEKHMQLIDKCSQEVDGETDSCGIGPKLMECIKQFAPEARDTATKGWFSSSPVNNGNSSALVSAEP